MKTSNIIKSLIVEHPEIEKAKKGFPNIGKRNDKKEFSSAVKKIEEAWYYYDTDLYKLKASKEVIKLGNGNPLKYSAFKPAIKYLKKQLSEPLFEYAAAAGNEKHRDMLAKYLIKEGFPNYLNYNNVIITDSTTAGFYLILKAIFRPYDAIVMTGPNYGLFAFMPERLDVSVEVINLDSKDDYKINPDKLNNKIKEINAKLEKKYHNKLDYIPRVRAFLNINPHNPLGTVLSKKDINLLNRLGKVAIDNNIFIIDDLIYRDLTYDRNNIAKPIGTIKKYFDNSISLFGLSKSYGLAQTRTGFIAANEKVIRLLRDNVFYIMDSASILQSSLLAGTYNDSVSRYKEYNRYFNKLISKYELNCYLCIAMINGINDIKNTKYYSKVLKILKKRITDKIQLEKVLEGIKMAKIVKVPESGFFLLIDFTSLKKCGKIKTEKELLDLLYERCGTKFLIGQSFSWPNKNDIIVRITYSLDINVLIEALSNINLVLREDL